MTNSHLLDSLNPSQKKAVEILSGPLLVLAGAGSGKTKVLTHRIANLIANGTGPSEILAVTFTNKAAKEMQGRIEKLLGEYSNSNFQEGRKQIPAVGTFHSICVRILRTDIEAMQIGLTSNFVIFDTSDQKNLMKIIMKDRGIDEKEYKLNAIMSHISSAKNQLITPIKYTDEVEDNRFVKVVKELYPIYQKKLIEHNALDFDDLLQKTVELYEQCPKVLEKYKNRWQQLLVDEYQDTNFAQYRFIRLLSDSHQNLCVVGDDHQSIYAFRGADFRNILDFEKDFPKANVVKLEQNYRSTKNVLENANLLIRHNETGKEKNLWTKNETGEQVKVVETFDEKDEARYIAEMIRDLKSKGEVSYENMAILYRMNAQSRVLEESMMKHQIPYQIIGGTRFFDRKEIKDIIAYLRLIFNPRDDIAFLRIINVPGRKLGKASIDILRKYAENYSMSCFEVLTAIDEITELPASKKLVLREFKTLIDNFRKAANIKLVDDEINEKTENNEKAAEPISVLLSKVVKDTKFMEYLDDGTTEGEARQQNVKELFSVAAKYDMAENPLAAFLEGVALISDIDNHNPAADSLTMMTMHASKGLEFPIVFLPGWEEGIFPSANSQMARDSMEEERRLAYVALTRTEKKCTILHARQRMLFGKTDYSAPSTFLSELSDKCTERTSFGGTSDSMYSHRGNESRIPKSIKTKGPDPFREPKTKSEAIFGMAKNDTGFAISDRVSHSEWGEGTIILINGDVLTVAFAGKGMKKIVASVAPIAKI